MWNYRDHLMSMLQNNTPFHMSSGYNMISDMKVIGDNRKVLLATLELIMLDMKKATHYEFRDDWLKKDNIENEILRIANYEGSLNKETRNRFPFAIDNAPELAAFVERWLTQQAIYPKSCSCAGGDGSLYKGYEIQFRHDLIIVKPVYTYYSK